MENQRNHVVLYDIFVIMYVELAKVTFYCNNGSKITSVQDLFNGYAAPTFRAKDEDEKKRLKGLLVEKAEQTFGQLEKRLGGAQYFVGREE